VAGADLGEGTRLAAGTGAWICFEDEAGQNLRPPKARTWAPRSHTPVVRVSGNGSGRVSVAGLVYLKPGWPGRLLYRLRIHRGHNGERRSRIEEDYAALITTAHHHLHAPIILCWDNLNTHVSVVMRHGMERHVFRAEHHQPALTGRQPAHVVSTRSPWRRTRRPQRPMAGAVPDHRDLVRRRQRRAPMPELRTRCRP
jgi:hypothetical protein